MFVEGLATKPNCRGWRDAAVTEKGDDMLSYPVLVNLGCCRANADWPKNTYGKWVSRFKDWSDNSTFPGIWELPKGCTEFTDRSNWVS